MIDITAVGEILIDLTQTGVSDNGIPVYTAFPGSIVTKDIPEKVLAVGNPAHVIRQIEKTDKNG